MKKGRLIKVVIPIVLGIMLLSSIGVVAMSGTEEPEREIQYAFEDEEDMISIHEIMLITSDLMMALDVKARLLSGEENIISFADGTEIKMDVPSSLIDQLDAQIEKLKALLIEKVDTVRIEWESIPKE